MSVFDWFKSKKQEPTAQPAKLKFSFEAASPVHHNLFRGEDFLSANAAANPATRRALRMRSRYQSENDSFCRGLINTLAIDLIGPGPRLQMLGDNSDANDQIESAFEQWAQAVDLPGKLRTLRMSRCTDGETFIALIDNPKLNSPVQLDLALIECDRVTTPQEFAFDPQHIDGIEYDQFNNPMFYNVLKYHPGDLFQLGTNYLFDRIAAEHVIHYYMPVRPGQARGLPDISSALMLFAYLRRWTLATVVAAETAASHAGVLETPLPVDGSPPTDGEAEPFDEVALSRGMFAFLPQGAKLAQLKAEHPTTLYAEFKRELASEIARCVNMPVNLALLNTSNNFSSSRLDQITYWKSIAVEQQHMGATVLDRIFVAWLIEAQRVTGLLPQSMRSIDADAKHQWVWQNQPYALDPLTEAQATQVQLEAGTTTYAEVYGRKGLDWAEQRKQRAKEIALDKQLGLHQEPQQPQTNQNDPANQ